jgi:protein-S-isoprenylcysteine O-methyltransferase Ste14
MQNSLELKIPPFPLGLAVAVGMWLIARQWPAAAFDFPAREVLALALGSAGLAFAIAGVASFRRAKTTPNPMRPENAAVLVATGPYRISRNPMYAGLLIALGGWALHLGNALGFVLLPLLVVYLNRFQIGPEEKALEGKFGESFSAYKRRVRRWI